jgi:hypothetical protein
MSILKWFETGEIDQFAQSIAAKLIERAPPSSLTALTKKTVGGLKHSHHEVFSQAQKFALSHRLNLYTKARMGNTFRWALRDAGYPQEFVDAWTYELVTYVALESAAAHQGKR